MARLARGGCARHASRGSGAGERLSERIAAELAAELGDGIFSTDPDASLVEAWTAAGGDGPRYAEAPTAFAPDPRTGADTSRSWTAGRTPTPSSRSSPTSSGRACGDSALSAPRSRGG